MQLSKVQHANLFWLGIGMALGAVMLIVIGPEKAFPIFGRFDVPTWMLIALFVWPFGFMSTVFLGGKPSSWGLKTMSIKGFFRPLLGILPNRQS